MAVMCVEPDCIEFIVSAVFTRCGGILQGVSVVRHCGDNGLAAPRAGRFCWVVLPSPSWSPSAFAASMLVAA